MSVSHENTMLHTFKHMEKTVKKKRKNNQIQQLF